MHEILESQLKAEDMNGVIRECLQLASVSSVTNASEWIDIARVLLRKLPFHMRQEAEFTIQTVSNSDPVLSHLHDKANKDGLSFFFSNGDSAFINQK